MCIMFSFAISFQLRFYFEMFFTERVSELKFNLKVQIWLLCEINKMKWKRHLHSFSLFAFIVLLNS